MGKWIHRSKEWIAANPGKPTMFKVTKAGEIVESDSALTKCPNGGVYVILCEASKHVYVGQSKNAEVRLRNHKMIISRLCKTPENSDIYGKMIKHYEFHGEDSFVFKKYLKVDFEEDLLVKEIEIMVEFIENGYTLYNRLVPREILNKMVYVPDYIRNKVLDYIKKISQ